MEKHPSFSDSNMLGALHQGRLKVYVPESTTRPREPILLTRVTYLSFFFICISVCFFLISVTYVAKFWISPETSDFTYPIYDNTRLLKK